MLSKYPLNERTNIYWAFHVIFTTTLWGMDWYYPHFTDEAGKAQVLGEEVPKTSGRDQSPPSLPCSKAASQDKDRDKDKDSPQEWNLAPFWLLLLARAAVAVGAWENKPPRGPRRQKHT